MVERSDVAATSEKQAAKETGVNGFLHSEISLLKSLPKNFNKSFAKNLEEHWPDLLVEAGEGVVVGATVAAITKNPALVGRTIGQIIGHENPAALGESAAAFIKPTIAALPYVFGAAAAGDAGHRLATPALDLMRHPENKTVDEKLFASNVTSLVQDYTVAAVGGLAGAKFSWERTAPYVNSGPKVDFSAQQAWAAKNPGALNKVARVENPGKYVFQEEHQIQPDVEAEYNRAFPEEERQAIHGEGGYNEKIQQRANLVYTLRNGNTGELAAAHILGVHDQPDPLPPSTGLIRGFGNWMMGKQPTLQQSMHGDFIFVNQDLRSQGVGSHMYNLVVDAIQQKATAEGKNLVALTGEMEDPKEPAVDLVNAIAQHDPKALTSEQHQDPLAYGRTIQASLKDQYPNGIQEEDPTALGKAFMKRFPGAQASSEEKESIGGNLQTLDERIRRQGFYWALPTPKVDSGIKWNIQDFNNPDYRGPAHWTSVVFDAEHFAPRETGYAFMTDDAGYTLNPHSAQVKQYMAENSYYKGSARTAHTAGSLVAIGSSQLLKAHKKAAEGQEAGIKH
jgi:hypothetical protein